MNQPENGRILSWQRLLPVLVLFAGLAAFFALDLNRYLSFSALAEHRVALLAWVDANRLLPPLIYMLIYVAVVAFSLPGGAVMTISGGFLFGALMGGIYAVAGATLGATALFLIAKTSLGDYLLAKAGPVVKKMQAGFEENALSYMFVLRLMPLFPFFLVNLAPAFLGVPLRIYFIATFFGIMPATFVFALVGAGLGSVFDSGQSFSLQGVLTPQMMAALGGLALLALLPVFYKKIKGKRLSVGGDQ
ncbi:MAG: TVP38/TMEM64 family protein [Mariprofundaceae bacterium]|nr:TVP38/TMEM64 family protein [Mariprofundaceae bacterium]